MQVKTCLLTRSKCARPRARVSSIHALSLSPSPSALISGICSPVYDARFSTVACLVLVSGAGVEVEAGPEGLPASTLTKYSVSSLKSYSSESSSGNTAPF